jgi:hypothetical protein
MAIDLQKLEQKFNALFEDENAVADFEKWLEARRSSQNCSKPIVSGSLQRKCTCERCTGIKLEGYYKDDDDGNDR